MERSSGKDKRQKRFNEGRRAFLKLSALTGTVVGVNHLLGPWTAVADLPQAINQNLRAERWKVTSCLNCPARCGMRVGIANGKAVKITGNPLSLTSEGMICPRAHIGLQVLYDPERIFSPLKRGNKEKGRTVDPRWTPISWDEALNEVTQRLKATREKADPHKLLLFTGLNSASSEDMIARFAEAYGTPNLIAGNGLDREAENSGNWMADGHYAPKAFDLDRTNYILAFGADLLESSRPLSRFLRKWGRVRREKPNRTKIVVIHPRYSVTACKSDEWLPLNPGTDAALALGMARVIIQEKLYDESFLDHWTEGFDYYKKQVFEQYSLEAVSRITGIGPGDIQRIAREFARTKPAIALPGKESTSWPDGSYTGYAIFCLNALVGSIDVPGGILYQENPKYQHLPPVVEDDIAKKGKGQQRLDFRGSAKFPAARVVTNQIPESILTDVPYPVEMAIGFNSNFNMMAPGPQRWDQALKKLPYYVHVSPFVSEMARFADLLLPSTTFLEEWGYDHSSPGAGFAEARIKQPVVKPRGEARSVVNILFDISGRMKGSIEQSFSQIGGNAEGFVKLRTASFMPWKEFLRKGVWTGPDYEYKKYKQSFRTPSKKMEFVSGNLKALTADSDYLPRQQAVKFLGEKDKYPLLLLPYQPLLVVENGSQNYPWAQEIFLPMHGIGWGTLVEINSETARTWKLKDGKEVWVESPFQKIKARVKFSEGVHPEVVAISSGQGHDAYGKWQKGIGVNPYEVLGVDYDRVSGQAAFYNTRVKVYPA